jgi:sugar (pentulose or hexulose) kinase
MITWFKEQMAYEEVVEAQKNNMEPEAYLNRLLKQVPPGSMGLLLQPFWGPGLKNPAAKGAIIGFGDVHTRAHIYRAVIEGLGFALLDGLHKIERCVGKKAEAAAVSGGASQSDEICQISADIFNIPMIRGNTFETAGLGAAIITAAGIGLYDSIPSAISRMVTYQQTFTPDPRHVDLYNKIFHRVYKRLYKSLYPLYREIREITGYPEKL